MSSAPKLRHTADQLAAALPPLLVAAQGLVAQLGSGAHGRRRAGPGETFWQYREYSISDSAADIDWRQSARSPERLFVREREWEAPATIRFWCGGGDGFDYTSGDHPSKQFRAQILCVAAAILLARAGEQIGDAAGQMSAGRGQSAGMSLAETLLLTAQDTGNALPPLPLRRTTRFVLISDFYLPIDQLSDRLTAIAASGAGLHLVEVTDPAEETFPFAGRVDFVSRQGDVRRRIGAAESVREEYLRVRAAHRQALSETASRLGAQLIRHRTDEPAILALGQLRDSLGGPM